MTAKQQPQYIVLYLSRLGIGGVQTFALQLAEELATYPNIKVAIFCHHPELADRTITPFPNQVELWTLSTNPTWIKIINKVRNGLKKVLPSFDLKEWMIRRYFLNQLKKHPVYVVHNNIQVGDENVAVAKEQLGIPYLTTLHGAYKEILEQTLSKEEEQTFRTVFLRLLQTAGALVYLSENNLKPFQKILPEVSLKDELSLIKIHNGLAPPVVPPVSKNHKNLVFGMVARGVPRKGWRALVEVTQELIDEGYTDLELRLYADGDYLKELMGERAWAPQIQYKGQTSTPLQEIMAFDVGLLPSYTAEEEMPFTIIEYLACQKPVIATNIGAIPEMLTTTEGDTAGVLIPLDAQGHPSKPHLKTAMRQYLDHPEQLAALAEVAKQAFQPFNIKNTAASYYQVYKTIAQ